MALTSASHSVRRRPRRHCRSLSFSRLWPASHSVPMRVLGAALLCYDQPGCGRAFHAARWHCTAIDRSLPIGEGRALFGAGGADRAAGDVTVRSASSIADGTSEPSVVRPFTLETLEDAPPSAPSELVKHRRGLRHRPRNCSSPRCIAASTLARGLRAFATVPAGYCAPPTMCTGTPGQARGTRSRVCVTEAEAS